MSIFVRVVALIIALLAVTVAGDVKACSKTTLLAVLKPLKSNVNYPMCQSQLKAKTRLCTVAACKSLINSMAALNLPNCTVEKIGFAFNPAALKWQSSAVCEATGDSMANMSDLFYRGVVKDLLTSMK